MSKVVSADHYFIGADGVYRYDPSKIGLAHQSCFRNFIQTLLTGTVRTVKIFSGIPGSGKSYHAERSDADLTVDNTCLTAAEISPYLLAAETFGATAKVVRVSCDLDRAIARQTHGVPIRAMQNMARDFAKRDVMPWWTVEEIQN